MTLERFADPRAARPIAALELNALAAAGAWGRLDPAGLRVGARATPIHDLNGSILLHRYSLTRRDLSGWVDVAAAPAFASPIVSASFGARWDPRALADAAAKRLRRGAGWKTRRFVAYSFPKIAVQFLAADGREVALVEAYTGELVPPEEARDVHKTPPSEFQRWSLLGSIDRRQAAANARELTRSLQSWDEICPPSRWPKLFPRLDVIRPREFEQLFRPVFRTKTRELHYSTNDADHFTCFELRGQLTNVWCVAASVQMLLDFYRYGYSQDRIATELDLGTRQNPNGLPYSRDGDVVTALETLSSQALSASMSTSPSWQEFVTEIDANRPLISFVPGHSRAVAGYTQTAWSRLFTYRGLLVYDPWPPTTGVITRWETFRNDYRRTFTAHVTLVP